MSHAELRQVAIDIETAGCWPEYLGLTTDEEKIAWLARQLVELIDESRR